MAVKVIWAVAGVILIGAPVLTYLWLGDVTARRALPCILAGILLIALGDYERE